MSTNERLTYYDGPLVWIDCEMTGLNYNTDRIIEIAVSGPPGSGEIIFCS